MIIKKVNDFILSIAMIAVSIFLLFSDNIVSNINIPTDGSGGGFFARSDIYVRMLGAILAISSIILLIKSLSFKKEKKHVEKFTFAIRDSVCYITLSLIAYAILLPLIGFIVSTFIMMFYLCVLFTIKERNKKLKDCSKLELRNIGIRSLIYSFISVVALYVIFAQGLSVILP